MFFTQLLSSIYHTHCYTMPKSMWTAKHYNNLGITNVPHSQTWAMLELQPPRDWVEIFHHTVATKLKAHYCKISIMWNEGPYLDNKNSLRPKVCGQGCPTPVKSDQIVPDSLCALKQQLLRSIHLSLKVH